MPEDPLLDDELSKWQEAARRRAHRTADAPDFILDAVEKAQMDERHRHLDDLLDASEISPSAPPLPPRAS